MLKINPYTTPLAATAHRASMSALRRSTVAQQAGQPLVALAHMRTSAVWARRAVAYHEEGR